MTASLTTSAACAHRRHGACGVCFAALAFAGQEQRQALSELVALLEVDPESTDPKTDAWAALHRARILIAQRRL